MQILSATRPAKNELEALHRQILETAAAYSCNKVVPWEITFIWAAGGKREAPFRSIRHVRSRWAPRTSGGLDVLELPCEHSEVFEEARFGEVTGYLRARVERGLVSDDPG